jgi:flavin reductase (DIM6/NTAB) family NADH-FMN oxidoreductase RutF
LTDLSEPSRETFDEARFRQVLGHYPTGVTVVTGLFRDTPVGLAVGSFFSVSLDPPLVGFCVARRSTSWPKLRKVGTFCANILASDQEAICRVFASSGADKFRGLGWRQAESGSPILDDVLAWIDCSIETVSDAGDHEIVLGRVRHLEVAREGHPLVFFRGGYHGLDA